MIFHVESQNEHTQPLSHDHTDLSILISWIVGLLVSKSVSQLITPALNLGDLISGPPLNHEIRA